jgi:hypothetical protein
MTAVDPEELGVCPPSREESAFVRVLDLQFWLMGRDVEHPGGNLLLWPGFTRQKMPDRPWPSRYRRSEPDGARRHLAVHDQGHGCLLLRSRTPAAATGDQLNDIYDLDDVAAVHRRGKPCPPEALARACDWFVRYEGAVEATADVRHRVPRPGSAPKLAPTEPCSLEKEWRALAVRLQAGNHDELIGLGGRYAALWAERDRARGWRPAGKPALRRDAPSEPGFRRRGPGCPRS